MTDRSLLGMLMLSIALLSSPLSLAQDNSRALLYELLDRMEQLERELRYLRGEIELLQHGRRLGAEAQDLAERLAALERQLGVSAEPRVAAEEPALTTSPPPVVASEDPTLAETLLTPPQARPSGAPLTQPPPGAREVFEQARMALHEGRYPSAIESFRRYINVYPENTLTPDATYGLAEAYYAQRDFNDAERIFIQFGSRYPDHENIPDALLRLGYIYSERNDIGRARQVLQRLISGYPNSVAATFGEQQLRQLP